MRKFLVTTIPIVTIILFVLIMLSGNYLKKPLGNEEGLPQRIELLIQAVHQENWDSASNHREELEKYWDKVVRRIQFSAERDEINELTVSIARLKGAIETRDKSNSLQLLYEAYEHWKDLGK